MSQPKFPENTNLSREDVINQIISSIAMEELGLSHIINAEGEKLQYALGTLEGATGPTGPLTIDELLELNDSIHKTLDGAMQNQLFLRDKLKAALSASVMQGPTGPTGPGGMEGATGPIGPTGAGMEIQDYFETLEALKAAHGNGNKGDVYVAGGVLVISDGTQWIEIKNLGGPTGPAGMGLVILGYFDTLEELITAKGYGKPNDVYVADGVLVISDGTQWIEVDNLGGPTGPVGPTGPAASSYTVIPFSSQRAPKVFTNSSGLPTRVVLLGFGYMDISSTILPDVSIPLDPSVGSFNLGLTTGENRQIVFSLPFDMKLNSIYATVGNFGRFPFPPSGRLVFPSVQIYYAEPNSNTFNQIPGAFAKPDEGIDPASAEPATMRSASKTGLSFELKAGTRIAIGGLMVIEGDNTARDYFMYFTGGIGLTPWIR